MLYTLKRTTFTEHSTVGELWRDGVRLCYTLEDFDRDMTKDWMLYIILKTKVPHETAIPRGTYDLLVTDSVRFKKPMPLVAGVPGFEGIRIHSGNSDADTDGCILVGETAGHDFISQSRLAFERVFPIIVSDVAMGDCQLEVTR
jgi:hypothetical protein